MKTLTITDAKKNLGKWLQAAAKGEDVAIISGADIIALRKVEVEANDYAWREYGLTAEEVTSYERRVNVRYERLKKSGGLKVFTADDMESQAARAKACANSVTSPVAKAGRFGDKRNLVPRTETVSRPDEASIAKDDVVQRMEPADTKSRG